MSLEFSVIETRSETVQVGEEVNLSPSSGNTPCYCQVSYSANGFDSHGNFDASLPELKAYRLGGLQFFNSPVPGVREVTKEFRIDYKRRLVGYMPFSDRDERWNVSEQNEARYFGQTTGIPPVPINLTYTNPPGSLFSFFGDLSIASAPGGGIELGSFNGQGDYNSTFDLDGQGQIPPLTHVIFPVSNNGDPMAFLDVARANPLPTSNSLILGGMPYLSLVLTLRYFKIAQVV